MNSGRSLIKLSCICFVCFPDLAVKAAASTNKTTRTMHISTQLVRQSIAFWTNVKYPSVGISLLTLIYPSYLTYEITFLTIGKWSIIPHSLWGMPTGRAFFQKPPTWIHQYTIEMPRFVLPNTLCIFFLLYISEISCQNSWVLPLSFLECVYFYSKCQESWNILIKKNWQL